MNNDKNIIYVEENDSAPFVFLYGQMLRNVVVTLDPDNSDYQELSSGEVYAIMLEDCDTMIKEVERTCIDFEVKYIPAEYFFDRNSETLEAGLY